MRKPRESEVLERLSVIEKELRKLRREIAPREDVRVVVSDPAFEDLARAVFGGGRTMHGRDRLWILWQAVRNAAKQEGAAAEVGTYRGGSAWFVAAAFRELLGREVAMEVIDTFEGHPLDQLSGQDAAFHHDPASFTKTSYRSVVAYLAEFQQLTVHRGAFAAVATTLSERRYAFVHLDVDLYNSMFDCLRYFGPRLVLGGVIVLDDYGSPTSTGVQEAAEQYLATDAAFQSWHPHTKQLVLVKIG